MATGGPAENGDGGWSATKEKFHPSVAVTAVESSVGCAVTGGAGLKPACSSDGSGDAGWYPDVSTCWPLSACGVAQNTRHLSCDGSVCRPAPLSAWGDLANALDDEQGLGRP